MTYSNGANVVYTTQDNGDVTGITHNFVGASVDFTYGYNNVHDSTNQSVTDSAFNWHPAAGSTISYATADNVNKYPSVNGATFSYDGNKNLTGDGTWSYTFDTENHLLSASKTGVSASMVYDPLHRQSQKTVGSTKTRYVYSGWQRIADYDGTADSLQNRYVYGTGLDEPLIMVSSGGVLTFLHHDKAGSIVATSDGSTGAVINKNAFGPFGETVLAGTSFGFTGQRYDDELELYYYKSRYYSPKLGRFIQPDPTGDGDGLNLYTYVRNSPLNLTDPMGLCACSGYECVLGLEDVPPAPDAELVAMLSSTMSTVPPDNGANPGMGSGTGIASKDDSDTIFIHFPLPGPPSQILIGTEYAEDCMELAGAVYESRKADCWNQRQTHLQLLEDGGYDKHRFKGWSISRWRNFIRSFIIQEFYECMGAAATQFQIDAEYCSKKKSKRKGKPINN